MCAVSSVQEDIKVSIALINSVNIKGSIAHNIAKITPKKTTPKNFIFPVDSK